MSSMKVGQNEYDLYMRVDTNTRGHRQWFYFSIKSKSKQTIKLNIYRFKKCYSLFQRGMKPYARSVKSKEEWKPGGTNVRYIKEKQNNEYGIKKGSNNFYLSFQYQFEHDQDQVFFAAGIPYTYSFLQEKLLLFQQRSQRLNHLKIQKTIAGKSMCGQDIYILKIEHVQSDKEPQYPSLTKRIIAINCRTHSGQASSSWVLDGLLQCLTKDSQHVDWIKKFNVCFHILPMLNVDGAIMGNYRTGIVGDDFNRKFSSGRKQIFPEISYLKKMISNAKKQGNLLMFMDLHGHSILKNSFIYGPSETDFHYCLMKKFPFYLWHKSKYFKMSSCKFKSQRDKIQTARMYFQIKENILSFTCQNSLGLYGVNQQSIQMTKEDWQKFGSGIIQAIRSILQTQKQVPYEINMQKQDLRETDTPPMKQIPKPCLNLKQFQPFKIKTRKRNQSLSMKNQNEGFSEEKGFQTASKIFPITAEKKSQKTEQSIFNLRNFSQPRSVELKSKLNEIRQRFPSLTSKQLKSKEAISDNLKSAHSDAPGKSISGIERNQTESFQRKLNTSKSKNRGVQRKQQGEQMKMKLQQTEQFQRNDKRQFLESIYHKKQLKELKSKHNSEFMQLGKNLTPSVESIKEKLSKKNQKTYLIAKDHHPGHKIKKYSCDISSQKQMDNVFDDVQISLKDIRVQRAITYDESYLAAQIEKMKDMKQTEREYCEEDDRVEAWGNEGQMVFQDNFSEKFDDSVNDEDSCDQDLPQKQKKYIINYIKTHQNAKRERMVQSSSSSEENNEERSSTNPIFSQKKRIHGFRQISFKQVCNQDQQKPLPYDPFNKFPSNYAMNSKIRKNTHKLKDSLGIIKYKSLSRKIEPQQKQEDLQIYITHKKKLNQRSLKKQARKDPFVLLSIKQKFGGKIN